MPGVPGAGEAALLGPGPARRVGKHQSFKMFVLERVMIMMVMIMMVMNCQIKLISQL